MSATSESLAPAPVPFRDSWMACAMVIVLTVAGALALHLHDYLHQDVAWLPWVADRVMRGAVYGRDYLDVNPPLNMLIYVPPALLGRVMDLDLAIKLWVVFAAAVSIACLWQTVDHAIRLPVVVALGVFFVLAFPREFGQREQFALLFCAPYVAGPAGRRGLGLFNGIMAGIAFALKPYFLVPLALVFITRRRIGIEEKAIIAVAIAYALGLFLFFQPWLTEMVPRASASYWVEGQSRVLMIMFWTATIPALMAPLYLLGGVQKGTAGLAMATIGFGIAIILHGKGFPYHFIPCFGFLTMLLAAYLVNGKRTARFCAAMFLAVLAYRLSPFTTGWLNDSEERRPVIPVLLSEIDRADSFLVLGGYNYPAFPTAILTHTPFVGMSPVNNTIVAVGFLLAGEAKGDTAWLSRLAIDQAVTELSRRPQLVIVDTKWGAAGFDGLAWFRRDPRFETLWKDYRLTGDVKNFQIYRRDAP